MEHSVKNAFISMPAIIQMFFKGSLLFTDVLNLFPAKLSDCLLLLNFVNFRIAFP